MSNNEAGCLSHRATCLFRRSWQQPALRLQQLVATRRQSPMFVHHKGATLIPTARRESVPAFQSQAIVHTQQLPWHSPLPCLHRLSFTHHHPTFSAKISFLRAKETGSAPKGADGSEDWDYPAEPCSRRAPRVQNPVALFGNRIEPGFPASLSSHTKQTIPTYRTRGPRRAAAPTPLPGRKQLVCSSIPSKSRYAPAELIRKRVPQRTGNGRARDGD